MIYIVDDDIGRLSAWPLALEDAGHLVTCFGDADTAYLRLREVEDDRVDVVIIDVMLAVSSAQSRFDAERTDDYLETGLRLLEDLSRENPGVFPARAVLLTNTLNPTTAHATREISAQLGVPLWLKPDIGSPSEFVKLVEALLQEHHSS